MTRFHEPLAATNEKIAEAIASGGTPVLQFGTPPGTNILERMNDFCREFGSNVQIRFFGFEWKEFDTSILACLPDVANLSIDTIRAISDFRPIASLTKLTQLRFGVFDQPNGAFLRQLDIARLTHLSLAENKRRNYDLAPLAEAKTLEHLFLQGHDRGIEAISQLPRLEYVGLSGFPKRHDLRFLNALTPLRSLLLILGSRQSIAEFTHPELKKLEIIWVRYLEDIGSLNRFSSLEELALEDQKRLTVLDLHGLDLRTLRIANCKNLERIEGLAAQQRLKHFTVRGTRLPPA
jgi:hypothetical protein